MISLAKRCVACSELLDREGLSAESDRLMAVAAHFVPRLAQGGPEALNNVNLSTSYPGPRWWPMSDMEPDIQETEKDITNQFRYGPAYQPIGDAKLPPHGADYAAIIPGPVVNSRIVKDRQEAYVEYTLQNGQRGRVKLTLPSGDAAQEMGKYRFSLQPTQDGRTTVVMNKGNQAGDSHGIWEVNGKPSVPGFAYIDEDYDSPSMNPSWFMDDQQGQAGRGGIGRISWEPNY
jgi:hypothetical protein